MPCEAESSQEMRWDPSEPRRTWGIWLVVLNFAWWPGKVGPDSQRSCLVIFSGVNLLLWWRQKPGCRGWGHRLDTT